MPKVRAWLRRLGTQALAVWPTVTLGLPREIPTIWSMNEIGLSNLGPSWWYLNIGCRKNAVCDLVANTCNAVDNPGILLANAVCFNRTAIAFANPRSIGVSTSTSPLEAA